MLLGTLCLYWAHTAWPECSIPQEQQIPFQKTVSFHALSTYWLQPVNTSYSTRNVNVFKAKNYNVQENPDFLNPRFIKIPDNLIQNQLPFKV